MCLAGVKHMTIAPAVLRALDSTSVSEAADKQHQSLFADPEYVAKVGGELPDQPLKLIDDEERFRIMFTRRDNGLQEIKQVKAINVFADMQINLEGIVKKHLG